MDRFSIAGCRLDVIPPSASDTSEMDRDRLLSWFGGIGDNHSH
jgi:hypothetical protein